MDIHDAILHHSRRQDAINNRKFEHMFEAVVYHDIFSRGSLVKAYVFLRNYWIRKQKKQNPTDMFLQVCADNEPCRREILDIDAKQTRKEASRKLRPSNKNRKAMRHHEESKEVVKKRMERLGHLKEESKETSS
jgi:hypothetical protein